MRRTFGLIMLSGVISVTSFAQGVKDKIENQARDPKTSENAAKADRYITGKKTISDSTVPDKCGTTSKPGKLNSKRKKKPGKSV